jgi:lipopolysaccharide/colanic/teichoic acid biosynthesis glycosyltransferase
MRSGEAYIYSAEKRRLDVTLAALLVPAELSLRAIARTQLPLSQSIILQQLRMGADFTPFKILKMRTIPIGSDEVASPLMAAYRRRGLDELPQAWNILAGHMSITGRRPLLVAEFGEQYEKVGHDLEGAKLVDRHRATAGRAKPGLINSHALRGHRGDETALSFAARLESDVQDFQDASLARDLQLIKQVLGAEVHGDLTHGNIHINQARQES